jgi:peptidoglycan/xylan/chitin deacetylase (PgdA/CDA1 family)
VPVNRSAAKQSAIDLGSWRRLTTDKRASRFIRDPTPVSPVVVSQVTVLVTYLMRCVARLVRHDATGLRILLWHSVGFGDGNRQTTSVVQLERQLQWLRDSDYCVLPFTEVLRLHAARLPLPPRAVVLTFDDACASFPRHALPCLLRAGFDATLLVPVAAVSGQSPDTPGVEGHMSIADIDGLPDNIEIGLHSFAHDDYRRMSAGEIREDLRRCTAIRQRIQRRVLPVFAYPFGGVPADRGVALQMQQQLATAGLQLGLRIGYGINRWPLRDQWRVRRITVHGTDSLARFVCKLTFGRVRI